MNANPERVGFVDEKLGLGGDEGTALYCGKDAPLGRLLDRTRKDRIQDTSLPPSLPWTQFSIGMETGQFGARTCTAG